MDKIDWNSVERPAGFSVGAGWKDLLLKLKQDLSGFDYEIIQVKEKFGGLRFYARITGDYAYAQEFDSIIEKAEEESLKICENCGAPGRALPGLRKWIKTYCAACRAKLDLPPRTGR